MNLTKNMANIVQDIVGYTPAKIENMSIEEIQKHTKLARRKNKLFHNFFKKPLFISNGMKKIKYSDISPRGSMIAANHRFTFKNEINRKIMKIK